MKNKMHYKCMVDTINEPDDCIAVALAIETLAYHNKNLLDDTLKNNCDISATVQELLRKAVQNWK